MGYLPQEIIGTCILNYFRSSDWNSLKDSFEHGLFVNLINLFQAFMNNASLAVISTGLRSKTRIYKFRIRNGTFATVKTEWSPVFNFWSKKLDFIAGKYTIIGEPENIDIFSNCLEQVKYSSCEKELCSTIRRHIFEIYLNV